VLNIIDSLTKTEGGFDLVQAIEKLIIGNRELAFSIAGLMRQHGKLAESLAVCELILRETPADAESLLLLVRNLSDQGQIEQALRRLREGRDSGMQEDAIIGEIKRQMLVAVGTYEKCLAAGDPARAEKICDALVELCPGQSMFLNAQWELRQLLANSYLEKRYTSLRDLAIAYSNEGNLEAELTCRLTLFKDPLHARQHSADQLDTIFHAVSRLIGADLDNIDADRIAQIRELLSAINAIPLSPAGPDASDSDIYRSRFDLWYRLLLGSIDLDVIFGPQVAPQPKLPTSFAAANGSPLTIDEVAQRGRETNAQAAFFAATSPEFFARFAETYVASILANCDVNALIFVLLCCPQARLPDVISGFPIQDPRLIFCCDGFDVSARPYLMALATETELHTVPIYYAYAALFRCDYILDHLGLPVFVTGIDTILQRGVRDLLDRFADHDVVLNKIGSHFGLGGQIVNNLSLTFPTPKGDLFIQFLKQFGGGHLEEQVQASFQDQLDIHMAKHHLLANGKLSRIGYFDTYDINNIMFDKGNYEGFREMLQRYRFVNIFASGSEEDRLAAGDLTS